MNGAQFVIDDVLQRPLDVFVRLGVGEHVVGELVLVGHVEDRRRGGGAQR